MEDPGKSVVFGNMTRTGPTRWYVGSTILPQGDTVQVTVDHPRLANQPWAYNTLEVSCAAAGPGGGGGRHSPALTRVPHSPSATGAAVAAPTRSSPAASRACSCPRAVERCLRAGRQTRSRPRTASARRGSRSTPAAASTSHSSKGQSVIAFTRGSAGIRHMLGSRASACPGLPNGGRSVPGRGARGSGVRGVAPAISVSGSTRNAFALCRRANTMLLVTNVHAVMQRAPMTWSPRCSQPPCAFRGRGDM